MGDKIREHEVLALIDLYNLEEPKNPNADPDELILADNAVTLTTKKHFGNLFAIVAEGRWGSGKTYTAIKIYHDLKSFAKVTYIPVRYCVEKVKSRTKVKGSSSLVASLIAMGFVKPRDLEACGSMTNADNINEISIDDELDGILEKYYHHLKEKNDRHIVILDELETAVRTEIDAAAIIETLRILRWLYDRYGSIRLMLAVFAAPIKPGTVAYGMLGASISGYIMTAAPEPERAYLLNKVAFFSLDNSEIVRSVMRGIVEKSLEVVRKKMSLGSIKVERVEEALAILVRISGWLRFGVDILKSALAKAIVASASGEKGDLNLYVMTELHESLGLPDSVNINSIFIGGKFGTVERDFNHIRRLLNSIMARAKTLNPDRIITYYEIESRREHGFESVSFIIRLREKKEEKKGREEEKEIPLVFWLRFTDLNAKALAKANEVFKGMNVIMLTLEGCRHGVLARSGRTSFTIAGIIYMPPEIMYYVIAGSKIKNERIADALRTLYETTYSGDILRAIMGVVEGRG